MLWLLFGFGCESTDKDRDGFSIFQNDCDDNDYYVNPLADEICDGVDNDCDGEIDGQYARGGTIFYADIDGDGYGNEASTIEACELPEGYAPRKWDCDEGDATSNPGADERCDGKDNDCDGQIDENSAIDAIDWYADWDGDGFGSAETKYTACEAPSDYVDSVGDCNDLDPYINPAAQERCDTEIDDNCDGELNSQDAIDCIDVYMDGDGDGFAGTVGCFCDVTEEYFSTMEEDCADDNPWINPAAEDDSPFVDQNCDGQPLDWSISAHEIEGTGSGHFGAVLDFEDSNLDGYSDMIASDSNGGARVFFGPLMDHSNELDADLVLPGAYAYWIDDVNGDGAQDIVNCEYNYNTNQQAGDVRIFDGAIVTTDGVVSPDAALVHWEGQTANAYFGAAIIGNSDITGDGNRDIAIASYHGNRVDIFDLEPTFGMEPSLTLTMSNSVSSNAFGRFLSNDFDFSGDGINEISISNLWSYGIKPAGMPWTPYGSFSFYEPPLVADSLPDWQFFGGSGDPGSMKPIGHDVNGDGHLDLLYLDSNTWFGTLDGGVLLIKLGPISFAEEDSGQLSYYDAEYWIAGQNGDEIRSVAIGPDLTGDGTEEILLSSTESNRVYILNEIVEGHTYVTDYGIYVEDPTPDVGFGYTIKAIDNLEPFGNPAMAVSRPYLDGNRGSVLFLMEGVQ